MKSPKTTTKAKMKINNKARQTVMTLAHSLIKKTGMSLSEAVKRGWVLVKLRIEMSYRNVLVPFKKVNGEYVTYSATLKNHKKKFKQVCDGNVFRFIDAVTGEIRCFKIENLAI